MWKLDYKERWAQKNWCFWTVVLEMTVESPLDCKEIKLVNPKGNQSWIFMEGLMLKLKVQYVRDLMWSTDSLAKTLMLGKIEGRRRREMTEHEMVVWHHWLDGHELEQTPGVGDGQEILACYSPWSWKESDTTEWLNWTELKLHIYSIMVAQMVKNLLAMCKTWAQSLGQEDPLEKGVATHSSILAWRIPWIEEPDGLQFMGLQRVQHQWATNTFA